ncbi:hypothetical protein PUNSTDRAFT_50921 [Punctularia strigosozonata HHB-11173 SS5]|uniref:uncharacterized protein n=1 Tax=Punctularia strigosozonata (strain HHB-11173) TaxID=741275 RepID=UPI0004416BB2|nr:uncharacterized protein PUNSTDRAFT_50921 [Punctularia strigosozonata HHB-11173 SS5]EIN10241.1 hypothetical protein PUNSTDRAFT_50921 [Punctularia strigosozonata HHB-11173 SS5]
MTGERSYKPDFVIAQLLTIRYKSRSMTKNRSRCIFADSGSGNSGLGNGDLVPSLAQGSIAHP